MLDGLVSVLVNIVCHPPQDILSPRNRRRLASYAIVVVVQVVNVAACLSPPVVNARLSFRARAEVGTVKVVVVAVTWRRGPQRRPSLRPEAERAGCNTALACPLILNTPAQELRPPKGKEQATWLRSEGMNLGLIASVMCFLALYFAVEEHGPMPAQFTLY